MPIPLEAIERVLEDLLIGVDHSFEPSREPGIDAVLHIGRHKFVVEAKSVAKGQTIAQARMQLERATGHPRWRNHEPLIAVDRMGRAGEALCKEYRLNWLDLSGNAEIRADNLLIRVRGKRATIAVEPRQQFNPFSRSASRIVHALLVHRSDSLSQRELSELAFQPKGAVSKSISVLQEMGLIEEVQVARTSRVRVTNWQALLDAWYETYKRPQPYGFGLSAAGDGVRTMKEISEVLNSSGTQAIFGGLSAAAEYTRFGGFRRVLVYVDSLSTKARLTFNVSDDPRGRNILFVRKDSNAEIGADQHGSLRLTSPYLTLLDLRFEPERSEEASEAMRRMIKEAA